MWSAEYSCILFALVPSTPIWWSIKAWLGLPQTICVVVCFKQRTLSRGPSFRHFFPLLLPCSSSVRSNGLLQTPGPTFTSARIILQCRQHPGPQPNPDSTHSWMMFQSTHLKGGNEELQVQFVFSSKKTKCWNNSIGQAASLENIDRGCFTTAPLPTHLKRGFGGFSSSKI